MKYVIIGNSAAAIGAVEGIRQVDRRGRITVISDEHYHTYSRPLISYWLAGKVSAEKMIYRDLDFYEVNNVTPILGVKAEKINFKGKKVRLSNGNDVPYDRLLIATGGKPVFPQVSGLKKQGVYSFLKFDDVKEIEKAVAAGRKNAVIIGAGLIGLKAAEALVKLGVDVTVIELSNRILPAILDEEAGAMVQDHLEKCGMKFELNNTVTEVEGSTAVTGVVLQSGARLSCDLLVVAIGVLPNTDLVRETDVQVNRGIVVNEKMETSVRGVYAAGDVSEGFDIVYGANRVLPLLPNAYQQGEVAGRNMAGAETVFAGGLAMNAIGFDDLPMLTAGIIKPDSEDYEVLVAADPQARTYRKLVLRDGCIVGYICLGRVDRAGILTGMIKEKVEVSAFKDRLLRSGFGYVDFSEQVRKSKLGGGAA